MTNVEALGGRLHQCVLDYVVNHLDEMARAGWATVKIAIFRGAGNFFTSRRSLNLATSRAQSSENWIEMLHGVFRPTDHHAVAAFQSPHAAAGANADIVDLFFSQCNCATRIIFLIGIATA